MILNTIKKTIVFTTIAVTFSVAAVDTTLQSVAQEADRCFATHYPTLHEKIGAKEAIVGTAKAASDVLATSAQKVISLLSKPSTRIATLTTTVALYKLSQAIKSILNEHSDLQGADKVKATYNSLKERGVVDLAKSSMQDLALDPVVQQTLAASLVNSAWDLATTSLTKLANRV